MLPELKQKSNHFSLESIITEVKYALSMLETPKGSLFIIIIDGEASRCCQMPAHTL